MPWNLKDFTVLFVLGVAILIIGFLLIAYINSNIESLQFQLQGTVLTSTQRATLQRSLNSWQLDRITLFEPFSNIIIIIGSITMLFSVIYSVLDTYRQKLERSKQEIIERTPINEKTTTKTENKTEVVPDSASTLLIKGSQGSKSEMKRPEDEKIVKKPIERLEAIEEKELLRGKLMGLFNHPPVILTSKRLIIEDRSINLSEITEAYAEQGRLQSSLVLRLMNGTTERIDISPEKTVSALTLLSGSLDAQESEMRAGSKATIDRWVNAINQKLSQKTESQTETFEERIKKIKEELKKEAKK